VDQNAIRQRLVELADAIREIPASRLEADVARRFIALLQQLQTEQVIPAEGTWNLASRR
jgi:hypothetical protein